MKNNKHPEMTKLLVVDSIGRNIEIVCAKSDRIKNKSQITISASQYKHPAWNIGSGSQYVQNASVKYANFDDFL